MFGVEGEAEDEESEVEGRPDKRQRRNDGGGEDEEEEELQRSGVFDDDDRSGDSSGRDKRARASEDAEERGRSNGSGRGVIEPEEEGRPVRTTAPPCLPTAKERREHNTTHHPPRSWCRYCVEGRGIASAHARCDVERVGDVGELHFAYCFLSGKPGTESATTIAGVDKYIEAVLAHVVPRKGTDFNG